MNPTEILVTSIGTLGVIIVALITNRTRQHAKATRTQVQNDHTTNLRDDIDGIPGELARLFREFEHRFEERLSGVKSDIRGIRRDVGRLTDHDSETDRRIWELEHTEPSSRPLTKRRGDRPVITDVPKEYRNEQ